MATEIIAARSGGAYLVDKERVKEAGSVERPTEKGGRFFGAVEGMLWRASSGLSLRAFLLPHEAVSRPGNTL